MTFTFYDVGMSFRCVDALRPRRFLQYYNSVIKNTSKSIRLSFLGFDIPVLTSNVTDYRVRGFLSFVLEKLIFKRITLRVRPVTEFI